MSIWQSKSWWEMLVKSGQAEKIFDVWGIQVEKRKVSMWEYWLFILGVDFGYFEAEGELIELCKKENCLFVQVENINYNLFPLLLKRGLGGIMKKWYYKKFITPYTAVIDLEKSEEDILKEMKPKGRYNIKLAVKKGIIVKEVDKNRENIEEFYNLMLETTSRDKFAGNSLEFYEEFLNTLENSSLLLAYKDEKVISAWIFIFWKEVAIYYYWASTSDRAYRNLMAPYLLQWEAIKKAQNNWIKTYDFLGIATPGETGSSLAWVTDFKLKLTKDIRKVSDSYIFVNKKLKYCLITFLRKLKK